MPATASRRRDRAPSAAGWSRYRGNAPRHLIAIGRALQARVLGELRDEHGHTAVRPSFTLPLSRLWSEGRPISALAGELGISAQACSQLVASIEDAGYLERRPNPEDGRSRVV